jgi:16S rRNA (guanine966-N2)-methyltransferase
MGLKQPTEPKFTITAGQWRGRKLPLNVSAAVRPSKEMVRQAGLDMLGSRLDFSTVKAADMCCGSGAWGLELLSRGAEHVTFVDTDTSQIRSHLATLGISPLDCALFTSPVEHWVPETALDLIIADPPYESQLITKLLQRAALLGKQGTWWLIETASDTTLTLPSQLDLVKQQRYGKSQLWLLNQRWVAGL